jgi:hypothetical protein
MPIGCANADTCPARDLFKRDICTKVGECRFRDFHQADTIVLLIGASLRSTPGLPSVDPNLSTLST